MKTTILKHRFLYLFILLGLTLSFNGCSDNNDEEQISQTFLEKYDGTIWVENENGNQYFKINHNENDPIDFWYFDNDCYYFDNTQILGITLNSENSLIIKFSNHDYPSGELTIILEGEMLKTITNGTKIFYFKKTTFDFNDFIICDY